MVVVPLLATFSHLVPQQAVAVVRDCLRLPVAGWAGWTGNGARSKGPAAPVTVPPAVEDSPATGRGNAVTAAPAELPASPTAVPLQPAGSRAIEDRLRQLGAGAIECQPLPGDGEMILASCRVAVDPSGQLQRVFQTTGADATTALGRLVADVEAWHRRTAVPAR